MTPQDGLSLTVILAGKPHKVTFNAAIGQFWPDPDNDLTGHAISALNGLAWDEFRRMND